MKYNQFSYKDQETKNYLLADAFGSILGTDLRTSVVKPLSETISKVTDIRTMQQQFSCIGGHALKAFILIGFFGIITL